MNKRELIDYVSEKLETTKAGSEEIVNTVLAGFRDGLQKDEVVAVAGFGTFTSRHRAARKGRNPQTGETLFIKESNTVSFRPAKAWKEQMN